MKTHSIVIIFLSLFFLEACQLGAPIKRQSSGYNPRPLYQGGPGARELPMRKKVALLTFDNQSLFGKKDLARFATEEFRKEFSRIPDYIIADKADEIFGDSKKVFSQGGMNLLSMTKKAKTEGIHLVIFGRILYSKVRQKTDEVGVIRKTDSFAESIVEIKVYDVYQGREVFSEKRDGNINDVSHKFFMSERDSILSYRRELLRYSVKLAVRRFMRDVQKLATKLEWIGRVARIIGQKVYVNAGRKSGLSIGDILKVITNGEDIYDPQTGALLGVSQGEIKGTLEVIDYFGEDGAVCVLNSGGQVTEGDHIQLY